MFTQIGLIALNVLGEYSNKTTDIEYDTNKVHNKFDKLEDEMIYDSTTLKRLKVLYKAKERAIDKEDFDEAKRIKDAIDRLKSVSQQLIQLEERKSIAIKNDDFDSAKIIKYEIERLRSAVSGITLGDERDNNEIMNPNQRSKFNKVLDNMSEGKYGMGNDGVDPNYDYNEPQQNYNNKKKQGQGTKMTNEKNSNYHKVPLTSDIVMDGEEKINKAKKLDPNQGFKKIDPKMMDYDNMNAKGMSGLDSNFNNFVNDNHSKKVFNKNEQQQNDRDFDNLPVKQNYNYGSDFDPNNQGGKDLPEDENDEIPANEYKKAEPLIPVLTHDIVRLIFSKSWKNKEKGLILLEEEIAKYPKSKVFGIHKEDKIITAVMGGIAHCLSTSVSQVLMTAMELIKILFNKFKHSSKGGFMEGSYLQGEFENYVDNSMIHLLEKIGDTNIKLKERAENTVIEMANNKSIGHKLIFEHLIVGQIKKTLVNSARHLSARINLVSRMIDNFLVRRYNNNLLNLYNNFS